MSGAIVGMDKQESINTICVLSVMLWSASAASAVQNPLSVASQPAVLMLI